MEKLLYVHGLGGTGHGGSATNIRKALDSLYDITTNTYDLLQPAEAFEQIKNDAEKADIIIASSLGGFYASALNTNKICILLNPCLNPKEAIPPILYPEQREVYNEEKCLKEWDAIADNWSDFDNETKSCKIGIFSDNDEYFSYKDLFDTLFRNGYGKNVFTIHGTHEIAKDMHQLQDAISQAWQYLEITWKGFDPGHMYESTRLQERFINMWFNSDNPKQERLIADNIKDVWELLDRAYAYLPGGPGGFSNINDFIADCEKSNALIKCVKHDGELEACAVYNLNRGGRKLSLIGAQTVFDKDSNSWKATPAGKEALYTIAREDIDQGDRNFWGEVSDGAETVYYVKTKAVPVPPSVVAALMPNKGVRDTKDKLPIRHMKKVVGKHYDAEKGKEVPDFEEWDEENRFNSGYYERPVVAGQYHRKVAVTSPENQNKVQDFPIERYHKRESKLQMFERILNHGNRCLLVLDIDDTIIKADPKVIGIWKKLPDGSEVRLNTEEFAKDPDASLSKEERAAKGISFDYREFCDPEKVEKSIMQGTPIIKNLRLMDAHLAAGWDLAFLTARSQEEVIFRTLRQFLKFNDNGEFKNIDNYIKRDCCSAINDAVHIYEGATDAEKKANVLKRLCAMYDEVAFVDDDMKNVAYARSLHLPNLKVIVANK